MGDLSKPALTVALMDKLESKGTLTKKEKEQLKHLLDRKNRNQGGTMKKYNMGGTMNNYDKGGDVNSANSISNRDAMEMAKEDMIATTGEGLSKTLSANSISNKDKMKAAFVAATSGLGAGAKTISDRDKKFLKNKKNKPKT